MNALPNLPSVVNPLFPEIFRVAGPKGPVVSCDVNGNVTLHNHTNAEAAIAFWDAVRDKILQNKEIELIRDLQFCKHFLESKTGIIFTNPQERIELAVWLGEIGRRYNLK